MSRRRAVLVVWTAIGSALALAGLATYGVHAVRPVAVLGQPALVVLGAFVVAYVQLVYPAVTWLTIGPDGFVLRTLPGPRAVAWSQVARLESTSALQPTGRGGNLAGVRVRDAAGALILIVPDVFAAGRDEVLAAMARAMSRGRCEGP